eukprot:6264895-Pyramimonas_sp.AAC.1
MSGWVSGPLRGRSSRAGFFGASRGPRGVIMVRFYAASAAFRCASRNVRGGSCNPGIISALRNVSNMVYVQDTLL